MGCGDKCGGCALEKLGTGFVPVDVGVRYQQTGLLVIGEAPGEHEVRDGKPFRPFAQAGSLFADISRQANVSRADIAIANVLSCRPPKDWLEGAPWQGNAIYNCSLRYLAQTIETLRPKAILALGGTAFRTLCDSPKGRYGTLDYQRGYVQLGHGIADGIPVVPTYHPAHLRRGAPELTPLVQRDLKRALLLAQGRMVEGTHYILDPLRAGLEYRTLPTVAEAWEYARTVDPELPLSFDIETPMSTRSDEDERTSFTNRDIKLFQCTQRRGSGIAIPFRDGYVEAIRAIVERCRVKVGFNNWGFDDPVLSANGIEVGRTDDAMVMFGFYYSDLPKNLQTAAQSCGFPFAWKHLGDGDLEFYGCADVDATLCVYGHMKATLEREEI